jgi:hypothetical protein
MGTSRSYDREAEKSVSRHKYLHPNEQYRFFNKLVNTID